MTTKNNIIQPTDLNVRDWFNNLSDDSFYSLLFDCNTKLTLTVVNRVLRQYFRLGIRAHKSDSSSRVPDKLRAFLIHVLNQDVLIRAATITYLLGEIEFFGLRDNTIPIGFLDYYFHNLLTRNGVLANDLRNINVAHHPLQLSQCDHERLRKLQVKVINNIK